ncbi:MAG: hypothetical protein ACP5NA_01535 [Candidatus Acidulodesulfobacterium sp.]
MKILILLISSILIFLLPQLSGTGFCKRLKNPFISPYTPKAKMVYTSNPLSGLNLQAIVTTSKQDKNVAIINGKPYYKGSKVKGDKILKITKKKVVLKSADGKIIKLNLYKFEGFAKSRY